MTEANDLELEGQQRLERVNRERMVLRDGHRGRTQFSEAVLKGVADHKQAPGTRVEADTTRCMARRVDDAEVVRVGQGLAALEHDVDVHGVAVQGRDNAARNAGQHRVMERVSDGSVAADHARVVAVDRDARPGCLDQGREAAAVVGVVVGEDDQAYALGLDAKLTQSGADQTRASQPAGIDENDVVSGSEDNGDFGPEGPELKDAINHRRRLDEPL